MFATKGRNDHGNALAWALRDKGGHCFLTYLLVQPGEKTFLKERTGYQMLLQGDHNLDHQFSLIFSERCDQLPCKVCHSRSFGRPHQE